MNTMRTRTTHGPLSPEIKSMSRPCHTIRSTHSLPGLCRKVHSPSPTHNSCHRFKIALWLRLGLKTALGWYRTLNHLQDYTARSFFYTRVQYIISNVFENVRWEIYYFLDYFLSSHKAGNNFKDWTTKDWRSFFCPSLMEFRFENVKYLLKTTWYFT